MSVTSIGIGLSLSCDSANALKLPLIFALNIRMQRNFPLRFLCQNSSLYVVPSSKEPMP